MTNKKLKILIVDDEALARHRVARFLEKFDDLECDVYERDNGIEALELLSKERLDLLFLDIQMPQMNGFEMLAQCERRDFALVFQTAYDEFAVRAFDENAYDYLLKPFSEERFQTALRRSLERRGSASQDLSFERKCLGGSLERIVVKQGLRPRLIDLNEVLYFVSKDHCTLVQTRDHEYLCDLSLSHLAARLNEDRFKRLHRNNIVSVLAIRSYRGGDNMSVELEGGTQLPVARSQRSWIRSHFR